MYNKIIENDLFKSCMTAIAEAEVDRIFCRHSIEHCLDVARIAYILSLEKGLDIPKDTIYATALLHDTGRAFDSKNHNKKSAHIAEKVLDQCGYSKDAVSLITNAILNHQQCTTELKTLSDVIAKADKLSRQCYGCRAQSECYWSDEKRNKNIVY